MNNDESEVPGRKHTLWDKICIAAEVSVQPGILPVTIPATITILSIITIIAAILYGMATHPNPALPNFEAQKPQPTVETVNPTRIHIATKPGDSRRLKNFLDQDIPRNGGRKVSQDRKEQIYMVPAKYAKSLLAASEQNRTKHPQAYVAWVEQRLAEPTGHLGQPADIPIAVKTEDQVKKGIIFAILSAGLAILASAVFFSYLVSCNTTDEGPIRLKKPKWNQIGEIWETTTVTCILIGFASAIPLTLAIAVFLTIKAIF